jgi:hypothetical protein
MGQTLEIAPLADRDVQSLYEPRMEEIREAFDDSLLVLHDLFRRYTGSWFGIQIPDEERALQLVEDRLSQMSPGDPFRERISQDLRAYWQLRETCERDGPSAETEHAARMAAEALHEQWTALIEYPLAPQLATAQRPAAR